MIFVQKKRVRERRRHLIPDLIYQSKKKISFVKRDNFQKIFRSISASSEKSSKFCFYFILREREVFHSGKRPHLPSKEFRDCIFSKYLKKKNCRCTKSRQMEIVFTFTDNSFCSKYRKCEFKNKNLKRFLFLRTSRLR